MKKRPSSRPPSSSDGLRQLTARIPVRLHDFLMDLKETNGVTVQHAVKEALEDYEKKKRGA